MTTYQWHDRCSDCIIHCPICGDDFSGEDILIDHLERYHTPFQIATRLVDLINLFEEWRHGPSH